MLTIEFKCFLVCSDYFLQLVIFMEILSDIVDYDLLSINNIFCCIITLIKYSVISLKSKSF